MIAQTVRLRKMWARTLVAIVALCLTSESRASAISGDLRLVNNGYEGLLVSISEYVPQEHCNHIIHGLKSVLSEFSSAIWKATGGRASLREVTVALPRTWRTDSLACSLLAPLETAVTPNEAHIRITSSNPVFGSRPWALQSQGCGRHGDYIQMGGDLLRATTNDSFVHAAHLLMAEWAKFRWGVFEERGYTHDPLYPSTFRDPLTNTPRPNHCHPGHAPVPQPFCATSSHIPEAPTKHNAQCLGRAAWDIILQSQDFVNGRNEPSNATAPLSPVIKYVQESAPRIVLVVEDTAIMNLQRRWEFVRKAVRRVIVYDVPDGASVSLVVFNSVAQTAAPVHKMDSLTDVRQRVGSSLPRNPSTVPESHKCVLCGLQEALRTFDGEPGGAAGANIIMITTGKGAAPQRDIDEMTRLAISRGVRVDTILYPMVERHGGATAPHGLEPLVAATHGSSYTVMDEGVGNDSKVNMMVALMDALLAAVRRNAPPAAPGAPVIVHSQAYPGGIHSMAAGAFTIDESLGPNARFSIYYYALGHVGNTVELTGPSGQVMGSINMQEEDGDANVLFVNIVKAERGRWRYRVENKADSHQGLYIQVTAAESKERKISLRVWTSSPNAVINATDPSAPVIIYAEVRDSEMPVLRSKVTAKLQRLGTNATGSNYDPIYLDLYDNGFGDPDITGGDGVYSRYLPPVLGGPGHYELSVHADDNSGGAQAATNNAFTRPHYGDKTDQPCCGSVISYEHVKTVPPFQRSAVYGVLDVVSRRPLHDIVPPTRILDLRAFVNTTTRDVSLQWTAPGDDYDLDRSHHYEAVLAGSWAEAKAFDGERVNGMPVPLLAGTEQTVMLVIVRFDQPLYVAIRGVDEAGNRGGVSNIASMWVPRPPTSPPPPTTPPTLTPTSQLGESKDRGVTQPVRVAGLNLEDMAVIIGSVGGLLVIVTVLATFCYCHVARRRRHCHKQETEKIETNRNVIIKTNSTLMLDQDVSQDSVDSAVKEEVIQVTGKDGRPLSPMQSWGASKLLQEHERRFSVTSGPLVEAAGPLAHYQNLHDPFPDVTLTGGHSYPNSQTPSTTHSDPPAYYTTTDSYPAYPYPYHPGYSHEELPPYTPGLSSQSSQASTVFTHEMASGPADLAYPVPAPVSFHADMPSMAGEMGYSSAQPPMYVSYPEDTQAPMPIPVSGPASGVQVPGRSKVPPPVAPKPPMAARAAATAAAAAAAASSTGSVEPKRRNVTQV